MNSRVTRNGLIGVSSEPSSGSLTIAQRLFNSPISLTRRSTGASRAAGSRACAASASWRSTTLASPRIATSATWSRFTSVGSTSTWMCLVRWLGRTSVACCLKPQPTVRMTSAFSPETDAGREP